MFNSMYSYNGLVKLTRLAHSGVDLGPLGLELIKYSEIDSNAREC